MNTEEKHWEPWRPPSWGAAATQVSNGGGATAYGRRIHTKPETVRQELTLVQKARANGAPFTLGVIARCQNLGCTNLIVIDDEIDFRNFACGNARCEACKHIEFEKMSPLEREQNRVAVMEIIKEALRERI